MFAFTKIHAPRGQRKTAQLADGRFHMFYFAIEQQYVPGLQRHFFEPAAFLLALSGDRKQVNVMVLLKMNLRYAAPFDCRSWCQHGLHHHRIIRK